MVGSTIPLERADTSFSRPNADRLLYGPDNNLSISDLAGTSRF